MRGLEAPELVELHERGRSLPPVRRAVLLLQTALPAASAEGVVDLPVGRRDARILELRARTLGPVLQSETRCPRCDERLELDLRSDELMAMADNGAPEAPEPLTVEHDGWVVRLRLSSSRDLLAVAEAGGTERDLLARCLVEVSNGDGGADAADLPDPVVEAVQTAMAEADPLADLQLALTCPACGHAWRSPFDPAAFFWGEIEAWLPRVLREVHLLASAYGWSEREILGMDAWRRSQYLRLVSA